MGVLMILVFVSKAYNFVSYIHCHVYPADFESWNDTTHLIINFVEWELKQAHSSYPVKLLYKEEMMY